MPTALSESLFFFEPIANQTTNPFAIKAEIDEHFFKVNKAETLGTCLLIGSALVMFFARSLGADFRPAAAKIGSVDNGGDSAPTPAADCMLF